MSASPDLPAIVSRAFAATRRAGYVSFCRNETGRLLAALAASRQGTLAEFGTGTGVGTAWLRSGAGDGVRILTAELDDTLARTAAEIFAGDDQVEVVPADWSSLRDRAPFSLLFLDAGDSGYGSSQGVGTDVETVVDLVEPGGVVVLDDISPCTSWPPMAGPRVDPVREQWLTDERFTAVEVMVAADAGVLLATKR